MTFLIRTIDLTATGREIVRDRVVEGDTLAIGRATTNDVVVADLAVEQHHVQPLLRFQNVSAECRLLDAEPRVVISNNSKAGVLGRGHDHRAGDRNRLCERQVDIARPGR